MADAEGPDGGELAAGSRVGFEGHLLEVVVGVVVEQLEDAIELGGVLVAVQD